MSKPGYPFVEVAMRLLSATHAEQVLQSLGLTPEHWELVTGPRPWAPADRSLARDTLGHVLHGVMDLMGLPRVVIPAELIAAYVVLTVDPINWMPACRLFESAIPVDRLMDQKNQQAGSFEPIQADAMFAMIVRYCQDQTGYERASSFRQTLRKAVVGAVEAVPVV